ncbi:MAG TPA: hypothetical protein PLN85_00075 [archaeon]|nr:hypothetical protein [archaeon]
MEDNYSNLLGISECYRVCNINYNCSRYDYNSNKYDENHIDTKSDNMDERGREPENSKYIGNCCDIFIRKCQLNCGNIYSSSYLYCDNC